MDLFNKLALHINILFGEKMILN